MESLRSGSILSDFCLDRLFDPEELYYVPMEELLKRYKKRDLMAQQIFNIAQRYKNGPDIRHRIITAPPMEKLHHRYLDSSTYYKAPPKLYFCTKPNLKDESVISHEEEKSLQEEKLEEHESWLEKRKKLRNDLNNMDMNLEYLKRKKDLTELEKRVLRRMMFKDEESQTDEIKKRIARSKYTPKPKIVLPTPIAMEKIEEALDENKWRLIDLFKSLDKNKDWKIQEADLKRECKKLGITEGMLDELLMAYGTDRKKLNYKILAKGRNSFLNDKRSFIKESSSNFSYSASDVSKPKESLIKFKAFDKISKQDEPNGPSVTAPKYTPKIQTTSSDLTGKVKAKSEKFIAESVVSEPVPPSRQESIFSKSSSDSYGYLKVPSVDSREDFYPPVTTTNRGTSAPVFYSIKYASRPTTSKKNSDKVNIPEMIAEFREKVKIDTEELKKARYSVDLNEEQLRGFEYPKETERKAIIAGLIEKKRKAYEKKLYDEKQAWIRKRLRMKMKLRNQI